MKKITFLFVIYSISIISPITAQREGSENELILSQSTNQILLPTGGLSCAGGENHWFRNYILDEEGVNTPVALVGVEFGVQSIDELQELEIYAYEYMDFPDGYDITNPPQPLASGTVSVDPENINQIIRANFDVPIVVSALTSVVVSIVQPGTDGAALYLGVTEEDTKTNYWASENCGITQPTPVAALGAPNSRHLINLVVDDALSTTEFSKENIKIYPNPAINTVHLNMPNGLSIDKLTLCDVTGKALKIIYNDDTVEISKLSSGTYFLKIKRDNFTIVKKIIKQ